MLAIKLLMLEAKVTKNQITESPEQKNIRNVIVQSYVYEQYTMSIYTNLDPYFYWACEFS